MAPLLHLERAAGGDPEGLLVLHHGRGTEESDLLGLADFLDPERRLRIVTPRAPLQLPGSPGYHWYLVPRVGYPDPVTFAGSYTALTGFLDGLLAERGMDWSRTVVGGFSMGAVMSYAVGIGQGRPSPAAILAFSGFVPTVEGWRPDLDGRAELPVLIHHGRNDPVISVEFAREANELLTAGGLAVDYLETDAGHWLPPEAVAPARELVATSTA